MKYKVMIKSSLSADGLGTPAISLYYAGCDKKEYTGCFCPGCQNKEMQDKDIEMPAYYPEEIYRYVVQLLSDWRLISDSLVVAFIGGEPLTEYNKDCTKYISSRLKKEYTDVTTILYTWRGIGDVLGSNLEEYVANIDECVLGDYREHLRDDNYLLGSKNQFIYNFRRGEVILKHKENTDV
jgi:pyruvate-formate lyase-activating enzyme